MIRGMANNLIRAAVLFTLLSVMPVIVTAGEQSMSKRVPAEWEPQEAILAAMAPVPTRRPTKPPSAR